MGGLSSTRDVDWATPRLVLIDLQDADPVRTGADRVPAIPVTQFYLPWAVGVGRAGHDDMAADAASGDDHGRSRHLRQKKLELARTRREAAATPRRRWPRLGVA